MLELSAAQYLAPRSGLNFELPIDLQFQAGSCVFLQGNNGAGKTSFLEEILLPKISKKHELLYLAQDIEVQQNAIVATLALLNQNVPATLPELISSFVFAATDYAVLVLDEVDKYFPNTLDKAIPLSQFKWVFTVSHLESQNHYRLIPYGYTLKFEKNQTTTVILSLERLW